MEDKERHAHLFIVNKNDSMIPALRYGDVVRIEAGNLSLLCPGDVVCFYRSIDHAWISRVFEIGPEGIRARGDNDFGGPYRLIQPEDVIGRVIWAYRGSRRIDMRNGRTGLMTARGYRALRALEALFSPILKTIYRGLSRKGFLRRWLPSVLAPRIVVFERPKGAEYLLFMGRQVIGQRLPGGEWQIKRPFRLFVEENSLP